MTLKNNEQSKVIHTIFASKWLANLIEKEYNLANVRCRSISFGVNDVYLIETEEKKYVLRISPARRYLPHSFEGYQQEVAILQHLNKHNISVNLPIKKPSGKIVGHIPATEGSRFYILFSHVSGKQINKIDNSTAYQLGILLADLHQVLEKFEYYQPRFSLNLNSLLHQPLATFSKYYPDNEDLNKLEEFKVAITAKIEDINDEKLSFGFIHGDFQGKNIHYSNGSYTLIDFDMTCPSYHVFDLAILFSGLKFFNLNYTEEIRDQTIAGYCSIKEVNETELEVIPYLEIARGFLALGEYCI